MSSGSAATWKVVLVFAGIFIAGGVTGGFAALRFAQSYVQRRGTPDQFPATHISRLNDHLKLDEAQKARIGKILADTGEELRRLKRDTEECFKRMNAQIGAELNAEQKTEYEEMQRRWRERMKNRPLGPRPDRDPAKREDRKGVPPPPVAPSGAVQPPERS